MSEAACSQRLLARREVLGLGVAGAAGAVLSACSRGEASAKASAKPPAVVVYTSVDDFIARPVAQAASKACGVEIELVTDTEATKTTGLLQRLLAERARPVCDVWWSNEALATCVLASEGLLAPLPNEAIPADLADLPAGLALLRQPAWHGCAVRSRVIAYSTSVFAAEAAPRTLEDVTAFAKPGRVAMARPQFGTTRSFFAGLVAERGEAWTKSWCEQLKAQGVQLLQGNSAVVRAIAQGSADVGLTDSDDVFVGQAQGWKVDFVSAEEAARTPSFALRGLDAARLVIPCTAALVARASDAGGGAPEAARRTRAAQVVQALLSAQTETLLAQSEAVHRPVRSSLATELGKADARLLRVAATPMPDWTVLATFAAKADAIVGEVFPV